MVDLDATRIVAPLRAEGIYARLSDLTPTVEIEGQIWIVRIQELAGVPGIELQSRIGSISHARDEMKRGLDILIDGFWVRSWP